MQMCTKLQIIGNNWIARRLHDITHCLLSTIM